MFSLSVARSRARPFDLLSFYAFGPAVWPVNCERTQRASVSERPGSQLWSSATAKWTVRIIYVNYSAQKTR